MIYDTSRSELLCVTMTTPGSSTQSYVQGLQTDSKYLFKLRARTKAGPGPPTEVLHVGTMEKMDSGETLGLLETRSVRHLVCETLSL